jgi:hypothetical protein
MTGSLVIAPRFCGPPGIGNGGYSCGLIAAYLDGPAEVTLRRPPPLATPMAVERDDSGSVRLLDGENLIAEGTSWRSPAVELPEPVSIQEAGAAGARCRLRTHQEEHPFPACFVCGPDRAPGDGLRILVGRVPGRDLSADVWYPDEALAGSDGAVAPEFLWAALDCAGGVGALWDADPDGPPSVLGRFSARLIGPVRASEPVIVVGWRLAAKGRMTLAGSALFTAAGQAAGVALATWIRLGSPSGRRQLVG